jgi:hypothetical protein
MIETLFIRDFLSKIDVYSESVNLGEFDYIGEFTAKSQRSPLTPEYSKLGAFFRNDYERGILLYYLVRMLKISSVFELGIERAYSTLCVARALNETTGGTVTSVERSIEQEHVVALSKLFPHEWFKHIKFIKGEFEQSCLSLEELKTKQFELISVNLKNPNDLVTTWKHIRGKWSRAIVIDVGDSDEMTKISQELEGELSSQENVSVFRVNTDRCLFPDDRDSSCAAAKTQKWQLVAVKGEFTNEW